MLKRISVLLTVITLLFSLQAAAQQYKYETVPNDPFGVKMYTLNNGLKVYLSVNKDAPRIQTYIAIKAGSKFDPPQTTGLAHYLEHMVFKGTDKFGTQDWQREKVLLDSISNLFEWHRKEYDATKKAAIYKRIDSFSYEASKYAIPNEYDKMVGSLGAQGTNAFTSTDMTVYTNDIPSNGLQKFLALESDRFQKVVLRLFHTELEAVYEEYNRSLDNDRRWSDFSINNLLLQNHPYGTQTTIGEGEHLKNPSMVNIYNYFNTYYRPNNCAIILSGDLDPDQTIALIEKYFGPWQAGVIPAQKTVAPEMAKSPYAEIKGPQPEHVYVGYLFPGANSRDALMLKLVDNILANGEAGLIDIDLVQKQKVLQAYSFIDDNTDFCFHKFYGEPKEGQSLEDVMNLLLAEIEKVKTGDFDDALIPAIVQNMKLRRMKDAETNEGRAGTMMGTFVHNIEWSNWVQELDEMAKITKADVMAFAKKNYNQHVYCYKKTGNGKQMKVEKPAITSVVMNKEAVSNYRQEWDTYKQEDISPKFLDFSKDITHKTLTAGNIPFDYIKNNVNKTFNLYYIFDMGTDNVRYAGLAASYLEYLGTTKYTSAALKKEFYRLGLSFSVSSSRDRITVSLSGLEENLEKGVALFEQILSDAQPDKEVYAELLADIETKRANAKKNKGAIMNGLVNYAKYGSQNPFNNVMKSDEMAGMDVTKLVSFIKSLNTYKHKMFYYGQRSADDAMAIVSKYHKVTTPLKDYPAPVTYKELDFAEPVVYTCNYPMKQAEVMILAKSGPFQKDLYPAIFMFNEYYGSGLSSIMFQEIREKMALAYSVYSNYTVPQYSNESHYIQSYVGTQGDKLNTALLEMNKLLKEMPQVPMQYEGAKENVMKTLASDWITRDAIYWAYDRALKRGLNEDVRSLVYTKIKNFGIDDLNTFFKRNIVGKGVTYCVVGTKESVNAKTLAGTGAIKEVSLEEIFGY
jgi:predicted Zn-dependent peptidase